MTEVEREGKRTVRIGDKVRVHGYERTPKPWLNPDHVPLPIKITGWAGGVVLSFWENKNGDLFAQVTEKAGYPGTRLVPVDHVTRMNR